jgi:hypothetical protein
MAGLCAPLPTLRRRPYGRPRTARGRCGSLLRHRVGLAPTTRCRSPGALRKILYVIYDNAMAESFFATLECELLDRRRFKTQAEARIAVFGPHLSTKPGQVQLTRGAINARPQPDRRQLNEGEIVC